MLFGLFHNRIRFRVRVGVGTRIKVGIRVMVGIRVKASQVALGAPLRLPLVATGSRCSVVLACRVRVRVSVPMLCGVGLQS